MWIYLFFDVGDEMKSQSFKFENIYLDAVGVIVGKLEHEGPLKKYFNYYIDDLYYDEKTFELAQIKMSKTATKIALSHSSYNEDNIDLAIGGDLSNQIYNSSASISEYCFSNIGIYAACASMNLAIILAALLINANYIKNCLVYTSSHQACAEKQFRYPNEYGIQKCFTNTQTITGATSLVISKMENKIKISRATIGRIVDVNSKNVNDMGSCMAFAAIDTFKIHMENFNLNENDYDYILTGDLSKYGSKVFFDELNDCGFNLTGKYNDCGLMIYDLKKQKVNAGGSGPACCPCVTFTYILDKLLKKEYKKVLVIATGALHSQISYQQKQTIPCIAHAIELEVND